MKVTVFRPGAICNNTAFEAVACLYKYLQNKYGYEFTIVKSTYDNFSDSSFRIVSVPLKTWKKRFLLNHFIIINRPSKIIKQVLNNTDIILTADPTIYPQGLIAIKYGYRHNIPVWFDASLTTMEDGQSFLWKLRRKIQLQKALSYVTRIIVTVPKCIERFQNIGLFNEAIASKFTILGHPVDTNRFRPIDQESRVSDKITVLVVSRLVPEKGLYYIIEAMDSILKNRSNIELKIIGKGPLLPLLQKEVAERRLEQFVRFMDPVPHQDLINHYQKAAIFVNHAVGISGWEEFFGVANLEAMSCGLAVIGTKNGGIPYVIREQGCAHLVEERNVTQLKERLEHLLDSKEIRETMGHMARYYVEKHYSLNLIAERYHRMLQAGKSR